MLAYLTANQVSDLQRDKRIERASLVSSSRERGTAMDTSLDAEMRDAERSAKQQIAFDGDDRSEQFLFQD